MNMASAETVVLGLLRERQHEIQQLRVEDQSISFDVEEWRRWFDGTYFVADDSCKVFDHNPGAFSRQELFSIAEQAKDAEHDLDAVKKLWLAVYAWGGGSGAMGYRARANARLAIFDARFSGRLRATIEKLKGNDLVGAYEEIDPVIGAGEAFFTKFLYFVSKPGLCEPLPLIYDEQVRRALQALLGKRWAIPLGATLTTSAAEIYDLYVRTMDRWAHELGSSPEQLELYFYKTRGSIRKT